MPHHLLIIHQAAEYTLLPHLLRSRALCLLSFILVEWHLPRAGNASAALRLQREFEPSVRAACGPASKPLLIEHENPMVMPRAGAPSSRGSQRYKHN